MSSLPDKNNRNVARHLPASAKWAGVALMALLVVAGCRSAPPEHENGEMVEQPDGVDQQGDPVEGEEAQQHQDDPLADPDGDEEVASHVDARIASAIEDAEQGDVDEAMEALRDLMMEPEGGFMAAYNLAVLHDRHGEMDEAVEYYTMALQRQTGFTPALQNLIRLHLRADQAEQARQTAREFIDLRPDNLDHQAALLEVWVHEGRYEDVVEQARDILRQDVEHVGAMYQMATAKYQLRRYELAQAILQRALELAPERAELFYLLGQLAHAQDNLSAARGNLQRAIELQPRFPEARNNFALLLHQAGNYERALNQLERVVDDTPNYVDAWVNKGNVHKALSNFEDAEVAYQQALDIDERASEAYYNLGLLYLEAPVPGLDDIPRYENAIDAFNEYREIVGHREADDTPVSTYISEASSAIEREQERQEALREAQRRDQDSQEEPPPEDDAEAGDDTDDPSEP